jgi:hypothetical protein
MVDAGQRFISVVDRIDTARDDWDTMLALATVRHGLTVPDAGRRVRRKANTAFEAGGMVAKIRFGYRKLTKDEAKSGQFGPIGLRETKIPEATPIYHEIRRRLMGTKSPTTAVEWLKSEGIEPGPHVKSGEWTVGVLKGIVCDPQLHGTRTHRRFIFTRIFKTGKYRRDRNPQPLQKHWPELAHMTREEQETMLAAVGWKIKWGTTPVRRPSARRGIPRKRSLCPGRWATCAACGGPMVLSSTFALSSSQHGDLL